MNRALVDKLAGALLYEGYILYPYRPCVKNRQRWTFGGLYPRAWSQAQDGTDAWRMQTQCLVSQTGGARLSVAVRFLHLVDRTVGELARPLAELPAWGEAEYRQVESLVVEGRMHLPWQEALEREVDLGESAVDELTMAARRVAFAFPPDRTVEPLRAAAGIVGLVVRRQQAVEGVVEVSASRVAEGLFRVTVVIENQTAPGTAPGTVPGTAPGILPDALTRSGRDEALMRSLASTHTILGVGGGEFVSLLEPPERWAGHAKECGNIGTWPVLVGQAPERDTMLSSPIILYDYPQIAPESPGDLFDATEIDEILTLRIMTMTDQEKRAAAGMDGRARELMERTESLAREQLMGLHGTMRGLRPVAPAPAPAEPPGEMRPGPGDVRADPFEHQADGHKRLERIDAGGVGIKIGDVVRLRPLGRADIFDLALDGKLATIVGIEEDLENRVHMAVTVNDDPGRDFGLTGQPGHRFFFGVEEVEPAGSPAGERP